MSTSFCRIGLLFCVVGLILSTWPETAAAQRFGFPPPVVVHDSVRGRVHVRNGPFRSVYRERWGNGITDNGLAGLNSFFNLAGVLGTAYLTGTVPADAGPAGGPSEAGEFSSESAEATHQQRMATLQDAEERANRFCEKLGISVAVTIPDDMSSTGQPGAFGSK